MISTVPLDAAAEAIHRMILDQDAHWRRKVFSPDYVIDRAKELGAHVDVDLVRDWESREDDELVKMLTGDVELSRHDVIVITDLCLGTSPPGVPKPDGAFLLSDRGFEDFVEEYRTSFTEHFIDGDVIVASPRDRRILVFHHEGAVFRIQMS